MLELKTFGSVCSGIEAATLVFRPMGLLPVWYSEIADFPSRLLRLKYPEVVNLGDMNFISEKIASGEVPVPDFLCGGTPCQAFSLAGWKNGLNDDRGQLTLKYIDILDEIDKKRADNGRGRAIFLWENVEGVLKDKTNAFGCFLAGLVGADDIIKVKKWSSSGVIYGRKRNVAWRVIDSKYLGLPQQRRRLYLLGGGKDFHPENVLFELGSEPLDPFVAADCGVESNKSISLFGLDELQGLAVADVMSDTSRKINNSRVEIFRSYTDCLYAAYGTKWNGNAAAYNGSLFVSQDGRLRRLTPLECERLMGLPDNYTNIAGAKDTQRYQAVGNSWAIPVVRWIAERLMRYDDLEDISCPDAIDIKDGGYALFLLGKSGIIWGGRRVNASTVVSDYRTKSLLDIIDTDAMDKFYISPKGCSGILRRKTERNLRINKRLEVVLKRCSIQ